MVPEHWGKEKILCSKPVPDVLTEKQMYREFLNCVRDDFNFPKTVITGNNSWTYEVTRSQNAKAPDGTLSPYLTPPVKVRTRESKVKSVSIFFFFFHCKDVVHTTFLPAGQTVIAAFYVTALERLRKRVALVRPKITDS